MEETRKKLELVIASGVKYLKSVKEMIPQDITTISNTDIMAVRGMCKTLLKTYVMVNNTLQELPSLRTNEINDFLEDFKETNFKVDAYFHERIKDIDSPDLDEILDIYKKDIQFLENWLNNVYQATVDLFTSMPLQDIQAVTIDITFKQISKHWHTKDVLLGLCDDLKIYKNRLQEVGRKLDYLLSLVNTAKLNKA